MFSKFIKIWINSYFIENSDLSETIVLEDISGLLFSV